MRFFNAIIIFLCFVLITGISCKKAAPQASESTNKFADIADSLKLNQIQVLGTHNSYAQPIDSNLINYVSSIIEPMMSNRMAGMDSATLAEYKEYHPNDVPMSEALAYDHPPLTEQLNAGLRSLEIDVFYDPTGNRFAQPAGYEALKAQGIHNLLPHDTTGLSQPGLKVLHIADFDFRSHCPTFQDCLSELKNWSDAHPEHIPVFILLEIKQNGLPVFQNPTEVLPFDSAAMNALDQELLAGLGRDKIIAPDDVRGNYTTLEAAVLAHNYPTLKAARGKFIFLMLPAIDEEMASLYWKDRPSLEGRMMFVRSSPGTPRSAFLLLDNAIVRQQEIQQRVQQGYLVRTRADIETYEAKVNDYTRAEAAFKSGAQVVSTDFFRPGNAYGTNYVVKLPGGDVARCNPVNAVEICKQ